MFMLIVAILFILAITYFVTTYVLGYNMSTKQTKKHEDNYDPISIMNNAENRFYWGSNEKYRKL